MRNQSAVKDVLELFDEHDRPVTEVHDTETTEESGTETAPANPPEPGDLGAPRRWPDRWRDGIGALVLIVALGLAAMFGWQLSQRRTIDSASSAALAVARNYAVILTSVDYQNLDQNFTEVLDGATGAFKDMYSQSAAQLRQVLIDNKAVSHGTVIDAAVKSATKNRVEVLIFIDQSITNSVNPAPRIDRSRVAIAMEHADSRWLAAQVDIR